MDGHHVALCLHAFRDEGLFPRQVADHAVLLARAEACGEHQDVVLAAETSLHHRWEVATLRPRLVDGNAEWRQPWKGHQQVVHKVAESVVVLPAENTAQGDTVDTTQRMVAHEGVEPPVVLRRQVLQSFHLHMHVYIFDAGLKPGRSFQVAIVPQELVQPVLVNDVFQPFHHGSWHPFGFRAHLAFQHLLYVDGFFVDAVHIEKRICKNKK